MLVFRGCWHWRPPRIDVAVKAGIAVEHARESLPRNQRKGRIAAGDIARWPDQHSGGSVRVEHWIVAERAAHTLRGPMLLLASFNPKMAVATVVGK